MKFLYLRQFTQTKDGGPEAEQLARLAKTAAFGAAVLAGAYFTFVLLFAKG